MEHIQSIRISIYLIKDFQDRRDFWKNTTDQHILSPQPFSTIEATTAYACLPKTLIILYLLSQRRHVNRPVHALNLENLQSAIFSVSLSLSVTIKENCLFN